MQNTARTSWILWLLLTAFAWFHAAAGLEGMPPYLATHFDGGGTPNGWMSPSTFAWFMAGMWAIMTLSFWAPRFALRRISAKWFNLPNKEYWLAPERRAESVERIGTWLEAYGFATLLGLVALNELLFQVNRAMDPVLPSTFGIGFFGYIGGSLLWGIAFVRAFRVPAQELRRAR